MATILSIPLHVFRKPPVDQITYGEMGIGIINLLTWLILCLCLFNQVLENRRLQARLVKYLAAERRKYVMLNRERREILELWSRQQRDRPEQTLEEAVVEDDQVEKEETGDFEIVPEQKPVRRRGWNVEDDLREAMEDELAQRGEYIGSDRSSGDENHATED